MSKLDLGLPGYQSMFESTEKADSEQTETFQNIEIDTISDFKDHPFHINMDEDMVKLIESIEVNGQLMPVLVRPSKNGYEMISGHRRKYESEIKTAVLGDRTITVKNVTPIYPPQERDKRSREVERRLFDVFVKYAGQRG